MKRTIILPLICIASFLFIAYTHLGRNNKKADKSKKLEQNSSNTDKDSETFSNTDKGSESLSNTDKGSET